MTKQEVADKILEILCNKLYIKKQDITLDLSFDNLGVDCFDLVEAIIDIEDEFKIKFPDDIAFKFYILTSIAISDYIVSIADYIYDFLEKQTSHENE